MSNRSWSLVLLLLSQALLIFVPLAVLGAAIGWPASLHAPPGELFPQLLAHAPEVRLGYGVYLLYSVLFGVTGVLLASRVGGWSPAMRLAAVAAGVSALARSLGILRWLTALPMLAEAHAAAQGDAALQRAIEVTYRAINAWGGGVGEALGVSIFAALWLALVNLEGLRRRTLPRPIAALGLVATALVLTPALGLFGVSTGPLLTLAGVGLQLWFLSVAVATAMGRVGSPAPTEASTGARTWPQGAPQTL